MPNVKSIALLLTPKWPYYVFLMLGAPREYRHEVMPSVYAKSKVMCFVVRMRAGQSGGAPDRGKKQEGDVSRGLHYLLI